MADCDQRAPEEKRAEPEPDHPRKTEGPGLECAGGKNHAKVGPCSVVVVSAFGLATRPAEEFIPVYQCTARPQGTIYRKDFVQTSPASP
jgi:hypothetical protein